MRSEFDKAAENILKEANHRDDWEDQFEPGYNAAPEPIRSASEVREILDQLRAEHSAETIDELIHYGGLRDLLLYGEGEGKMSVEDAVHQAHMNS